MKKRMRTMNVILLAVMAIDAFLFLAAPIPLAEAATQNAYRWRNDDGTEASATWAAAENTQITIDKMVPKRVRFGVANSVSDPGFARKSVMSLEPAFIQPTSSFVDLADGYAYFGTWSGGLAKVRLSDFTVVSMIDAGDTFTGAVLDASGPEHYGYFSSSTSIKKVRLSDMTVVASLNNVSTNQLYDSVIDVSGGFAYFGVSAIPAKVIKVRLSDFSVVSTLTFNAGEDYIRAAAIDTAAGFAYFAVNTSPGRVVKVQLSDFTRVAGLDLLAGENYPESMAIDPSAGYLYVGIYTGSGPVVRIRLSDFTRDGALSTGAANIQSATIDTSGPIHYAYFGTNPDPGKIVKVRLSDFTVSATMNLAVGEYRLDTATIDPAGGFAYFAGGSNLDLGRIIKIRLSDFTKSASIVHGEHKLYSSVIDEAAGFAYFGTLTVPGRIIKVRTSDFSKVSTLTLDYGDNSLTTAVIDPGGGFAYFASGNQSGRVHKIRLSDFTRVGTLALPVGDRGITSSVIDAANGHAYFGVSYGSTSKVIKVRLSDLTKVGELVLNGTTDGYPSSATIDTENGFAYFGTTNSPGRIIKVQLSDFTKVGVLTLSGDANYLSSAVIDTSGATNYAYFGSLSSPYPGRIAKVDLSTFTHVGTLNLNSGSPIEGALVTAVIDTSGPTKYAYFGAYEGVAKINLSTFTREGFAATPLGEQQLYSSVIDVGNKMAYFGSLNDFNGKVIKFSLVGQVEPRLEYGRKTSTCAAITSWRQTDAGKEWEMADSSYFTHGAATTNVSPGVADGKPTFMPGKMFDASARGTSVQFFTDEFSEVEFSVRPTMLAADGGTYCFRLTDFGDSAVMSYTNYAEATLAPTYRPTQLNRVSLSRLMRSQSGTLDISFVLQASLSGTITITFPMGFTVNSAFTGGTCTSGTVDTFGFTSSTLTAVKHSCSGTVTLTGASVTNPSTAGIYTITWVNDDPGSGTVVITDDDQVTVSGTVDPTITMNVGSQAAATACDGTFAGNGGTVALGVLSISSVSSSDAVSIPHICSRVTTNASSGAIMSVRSAFGALQSSSTPADQILSASATPLGIGTAGYGMCIGSAVGDTGKDATTPAGATPARTAPFNGTCTGTDHNIGALTTAPATLWTLSSPSQNAFARIYLKASISPTTPAHNDYADTLTFVVTGTY